MKLIKTIIIVFTAGFLISLFFIYDSAHSVVNGGFDRPQWEEELGIWDYFLTWSLLSLNFFGFCCVATIGIMYLIRYLKKMKQSHKFNKV